MYSVGIDFGTNTARAVVVDVATGEEIGTGIAAYRSGEKGVVVDDANPHVARHHPGNYAEVTRDSVRSALESAKHVRSFRVDAICGIGLDATASTPIPVSRGGVPLALTEEFAGSVDTLAWLWKDHSAVGEAEEITAVLRNRAPAVLDRIGGVYSSEWFWAKLLRFSRVAPGAFAATHSWIEVSDWFAAWLVGERDPNLMSRGICAAGHKALYDSEWNGFVPDDVVRAIDPALARIRETMRGKVRPPGSVVGMLSRENAEYLGVPAGIPVAVPVIDAHIGALGSGIETGRMVKIMGTSGVDLVVTSLADAPDTIPGVSGVVPHSVLPGFVTVEAGQSAVGDIYGWIVEQMRPTNESHESLTRDAERLRPGETGLLGLDWLNGNRTVLIDQRLSGLVVGLNLRTQPNHLYRSMIEATAFGSRVIIDRLSEFGVDVEEIVTSGGLPGRNSLVMQVFADVLERRLRIARSDQTAALGSAICAAAAADLVAGGRGDIQAAVQRMVGFRSERFSPIEDNVKVYRRLYALYRELHDAFGTTTYRGTLQHVMKDLLHIRSAVSS